MEISPIQITFGSNYIIPYSCAKNKRVMKNCLRHLRICADQNGFIETSHGVLFNTNYRNNETKIFKNVFELFNIKIKKINNHDYISRQQINDSYEYMAKKLYPKRESEKVINKYYSMGDDKYVEFARLQYKFENSDYSSFNVKSMH